MWHVALVSLMCHHTTPLPAVLNLHGRKLRFYSFNPASTIADMISYRILISKLAKFSRKKFIVFATLFFKVPLRLKKREGCDLVAHQKLTAPRITMEWLLAESRSFSNLLVLLDLNGPYLKILINQICLIIFTSDHMKTSLQVANSNTIKILKSGKIWETPWFW